MLLTVSGKKFCHPTEAFFSCKKQKRICCSTFFSKVFIIIIIFLDSSQSVQSVSSIHQASFYVHVQVFHLEIIVCFRDHRFSYPCPFIC